MAITEKYASSAGAGAKDGSTEGNAWDWATMLTAAAAGDRINFKGNHTLTGHASFSNAGSATSPIILRGYSSSIGDCSSLGRTNGNGPLITTGMPVITCGTSSFFGPAFSVVEACVFTGSANSYVVRMSGNSVFFRSKATNTGTGASAVALTLNDTGAIACDSDLILSGGSGGIAAIDLYGYTAIWCRADGGAAAGLRASSPAVVIGCTVYSSGTDAVLLNSTSNNITVVGCTLVSSGSDGVHLITGATRLSLVAGNLIADNIAYGIYAVDAAAGIFAIGNRIDRNTSGATNGATDWLAAFSGFNNTTSATQANEFPGAGSDDYRLGPTSPARQIGIPLYMDIGALQRIEDYPTAANTLNDDTVDGAAGTYAGPAVADVKSGVQFGASGTEYTGTYSGGAFIGRRRRVF